MQVAEVGALVGSVNSISNFGVVLETSDGRITYFAKGHSDFITGELDRIIRIGTKLGLAASVVSAVRLKDDICAYVCISDDTPLPIHWPLEFYGRISRLCLEVSTRVRDELDLKRFLVVPLDKIDLYEGNCLFGVPVRDRYPSTIFEVEEAGRCLSLGLYTSSVFHLMRVMEIGFRAASRALGVPDPVKPGERNWGKMLDNIKAPIGSMSAGKQKDVWQELYAFLDAVKDAWRNSTMHVDRVYTDDQAMAIYYAVRAFMQKICSMFDENGNP